MNFNKNPIDKISEDRLDWLLKNQSLLNNVPEDVNNKIINYYRNKNHNPELKKNLFFTNNLKFLAVAACFIIITGISLYLFNNYINNKNRLYCKIIQSEGNITINDKKYIDSLNKKYFLKGKTIKTGENSKIHFIIGNNSIIKLYDLSQIKILQNKKDNNDEFNKIYLIKGSINCSVQLPTIKSIFEVMIDSALFSVKSTKFNIEIKDNKDVLLDVTEGVVEIRNYINIDTDLDIIKNKYNDIYNDLIKINDIKLIIKKGESIILQNNLIEEYNKKQNEFINEIKLIIKNKKELSNEDKEIIYNKINTLIKEGNEIQKYSGKNGTFNEILIEKKDAYKNNNNIIIKKLPSKINIKLSELDTAITSDNKNLYVSSGINKTIYCVDSLNGNLKWELNDKRIKNIASPAFPFKDKILLSSPDNIAIINMDGKIIEVKDIPIGTSYWATPIIIKDSLYIPTFDTIYKYNDKDMILEKVLQSNGQIYANSDLHNIYYTILNEKKIKIYDINKKINIWESEKFLERVFMPPIIGKNNIFIGDIKGNIYKYDISTNIVATIKIQAGLISDIIYNNGYLYFIANDGFFYRINTESFINIEKIKQVDVNPDLNKYLTKKLIINDNSIYFCSDIGKLFIYDIINNNAILNNIPDNINNLPLIGSPVIIGNNIYIIDVEFNIFKLTK